MVVKRKNPWITELGAAIAILALDMLAFQSLMIIYRELNWPYETWFAGAYWLASLTILVLATWSLHHFHRNGHDGKSVLMFRISGFSVLSLVPKFILSFGYLLGLTLVVMFEKNMIDNDEIIFWSRVSFFPAAIAFLLILYSILGEKYRVRLHRVTIPFDKGLENGQRIRIAQFSDIHLGSLKRRKKHIKKAFHRINSLEPDLIVFTGDLVNNFAEETGGWAKDFASLSAKYGKYAVLGNHDYGDYCHWDSEAEKKKNFEKILDFLEKTGFRVLRNEGEQIRIGDIDFSLIGVEYWGPTPYIQYGDLHQAVAGHQEKVFKVLLSHDPKHWEEEVTQFTDIDLTLSGHTHGGQLGIRFGKKHWSPAKKNFPQYAGLYREGDQYLYVNRGLGHIGFPGRLGMRPEISFLDVEL